MHRARTYACRSNSGFLECRTDNKRSFPTCTPEIVSVCMTATFFFNLYSRSDVTLAEIPNYGFSALSPLDLLGLEHNLLVQAHVDKRSQAAHIGGANVLQWLFSLSFS
jgi:hypothetical protein